MSGPTQSPPEPVSAQEVWIVENRVTAIRVEYRMTGTDTAETYLHLTPFDGKAVCWMDSTFRKVADLRLSYNTICEPKHGLREKVEARKKWEKSNAAELTLYKRLREKYGESA